LKSNIVYIFDSDSQELVLMRYRKRLRSSIEIDNIIAFPITHGSIPLLPNSFDERLFNLVGEYSYLATSIS